MLRVLPQGKFLPSSALSLSQTLSPLPSPRSLKYCLGRSLALHVPSWSCLSLNFKVLMLTIWNKDWTRMTKTVSTLWNTKKSHFLFFS